MKIKLKSASFHECARKKEAMLKVILGLGVDVKGG
jgi:hypothetical protein